MESIEEACVIILASVCSNKIKKKGESRFRMTDTKKFIFRFVSASGSVGVTYHHKCV